MSDVMDNALVPFEEVHKEKDVPPDVTCLECFKTEIPPAKIVTDKERDIWDIKSLNFNMKSVSRSSPFLEYFLQNCEQQLEDNLRSMNLNVQTVNSKTENCIRTSCETFLSFLKDFDDTVEDWKTLISSGKIPLTAAMMIKHEILNLNALEDLLGRRKEAIENFHNDLISIENLRVRENVEVLRNANARLTKSAVRKPSEIRELLEMEILRINQLVLNNVRYYEDLKLNFHLHGEKIRISFKDYIDKCQKIFAEKLLKAIQEKIDELDPDKEFFNSDEGKNALQSLYTARELITDLIKQQVGHIRFSVVDANEWTKKIQKAAEELDETARMVISIYKKITCSLFQGRMSELEKFLEEYMGIGKSNPPEKKALIEELQKKVFNPVLVKEEAYKTRVSEVEAQWRELMSDMQRTLQGTFTFLNDSSNIWERHFSRTKEAKNIITMKLVSTVADQTIAETESEKELNVVIDVLRQEAAEDKLKQAIQKVFDMLSDLEEQYGKHYTERQLIVEKYTSIMGAEIKVLQSEIEQFLNIYPSEYYNDYFVRRQEEKFNAENAIESKNTFEGEESEKCDLPHELWKCQYQTDALRNWKLGLREAILFYHIVCDKEMERNMKRWMEKQSDSITRNFDVKLTLLHARYQRIKTEIYDLRLSELQTHLQRFESHVLGVQHEVQDLTENSQAFQKEISDNIYPEFNKILGDLAQKGKAAESTIEVNVLITQAEDLINTFSYTMESLLQEYLNETSNKMSWIQKSNLNYTKSLKLFSNGGNFHPDEVQIITGELDKLTQDVDSRGSSFRKHATDKQMALLKNIRHSSEKLLQWLRGVYDEIHFSEKVTLTILRVRDFIKKEVKHMKYNRKLLSSKVDVLLTEMPETGGTDLLTFIKEYWRPLLHAMEQQYKYLVQPLPTNRISKLAGLRFNGFEAVSAANKKGAFGKALLSHSTSSRVCIDLLFDNNNPPLGGSSFLEKICNCIWGVFGPLQEAALDFYKGRKWSHVIKKDRVKSTFNEFMEETLIRFKYYHLQCEEVWLEEVQEYFSLLERIKHACNVFVEQSILKFHTNRMDAVSTAHNMFVHQMEDLDRHHIDMRTILSKKLKPLHGFPGNKNLLKDLTQEIKNANNSMDKETHSYVTQYKEYLKDREEAYRSDIRGLGVVLERLLNALFVSPRLTESLAEQSQEVLQGIAARSYLPPALTSVVSAKIGKSAEIRTAKQKRKEGALKEEKKSQEPQTAAASKAGDDGEKVPKAFRLSIDKSDASLSKTAQKQVKGSSNAEKGSSQLEGKAAGEQDDNASVEGEGEEEELMQCNIASIIAMSEEEFEDYARKCELMASKYVLSCSEEGKVWFKLFKKHAEKVKELYTVQHE